MLTDTMIAAIVTIGFGAAMLSDMPQVGTIAARKVGGIWFFRAWRIRVSFCIARAR